MNNIQKKLLIIAANQIKKTAIIAAGTTSFWGAYQPKEPKILNTNK
jgi:cyclic lactone autoinducer peptide